MSLANAREIEARLRALGTDKDIRLTQKAGLKVAVKPFVARAKELAPYNAKAIKKKGAKHLRDQIGVGERTRDRKAKETDSIVANIYVGMTGKNVGVIDEFGTGPRYTKGKAKGKQRRGGGGSTTADKKYGPGAYRGMRKATPFLRPAWEEKKFEVLDTYGKILGSKIEDRARRIAARDKK